MERVTYRLLVDDGASLGVSAGRGGIPESAAKVDIGCSKSMSNGYRWQRPTKDSPGVSGYT